MCNSSSLNYSTFVVQFILGNPLKLEIDLFCCVLSYQDDVNCGCVNLIHSHL